MDSVVRNRVLEHEAGHEEAERDGGDEAKAAREEERMVDHVRAGPLAHEGARVVAGDGEGGGRVDVRDEDARDGHEAGEDHRGVATEAGGNRDEQGRGGTLREEQSGHAEEGEGEEARPYFARLRELRDEAERRFGVDLPHLSMGMSGDYRQAVAEGATLVRVGTDIFGPRPLRP